MPRTAKKKAVPVPPGTVELAVFDPADAPADTSLPKQVAKSIRAHVRAGYMSDAEVRRAVEDDLEGAGRAGEVTRLIASALPKERALHRSQVKSWPEVTDCRRLTAAFSNLEKSGILARENFLCCENCGSTALMEEATSRKGKKSATRGYVFFHDQQTTDVVRTGTLRLCFGAVSRKSDHTAAVAREVVAALKKGGLKPKWSGRVRDFVVVKMKWQRSPSR